MPREVSSDRLVRHLQTRWGYTVLRQSGSHLILGTESPLRHRVPVPFRDAVGPGLLRAIVRQVASAKGVPADEVMRDL